MWFVGFRVILVSAASYFLRINHARSFTILKTSLSEKGKCSVWQIEVLLFFLCLSSVQTVSDQIYRYDMLNLKE